MDSDWKDYRSAQKNRRSIRMPVHVKQIHCLKMAGFSVRRLTAFQFRINDMIDLYPIHRRFHDIKTGERGDYKDALELCKQKTMTLNEGKTCFIQNVNVTNAHRRGFQRKQKCITPIPNIRLILNAPANATALNFLVGVPVDVGGWLSHDPRPKEEA